MKFKRLLHFISGIFLIVGGIFLVFQHARLSMSYGFFGTSNAYASFGLILLPLLIGVGMVFFQNKSKFGWILIVFGVVSILLSILMGLRITFPRIALYEGLLMFVLIAAGLGVFIKGLSIGIPSDPYK